MKITNTAAFVGAIILKLNPGASALTVPSVTKAAIHQARGGKTMPAFHNGNNSAKNADGVLNTGTLLKSSKSDSVRAADSNVQKAIKLWLRFNFFIAPIRDGLNPFVSVYLVTFAGLSPAAAGGVLFTREIAMMSSQFPMGALVDYSKHKRFLVLLFTLVCTIAPLAIIFTNSIPILIAKSILEGVANSGLTAMKGPFTLGISGNEKFEDTSKFTEIAQQSGAFVSAIGAGTIAFLMYPNVELLFGVIGVFGTLALSSILLMPTRSVPAADGSTFKIVDDELARNSKAADDDDNDKESKSVWKFITSDKNFIFLMMGIFLFHLGNAAVLPMLGQTLALEGGRAGVPYTSANIALAQVTAIGATYMMDKVTKKGVRINVPILIGFGAQALRIGIILGLSTFWKNPYALVSTQLLDGVGAGVNGLAIVQLTKALTSGTGGFGLAFSAVNFCNFLGGALSNLVSGLVVTYSSYRIGFAWLLCPILASLFFINLVKVPGSAQSKKDN